MTSRLRDLELSFINRAVVVSGANIAEFAQKEKACTHAIYWIAMLKSLRIFSIMNQSLIYHFFGLNYQL